MLARIDEDWREARLGARREAMCVYALRLTREPTSITKHDIKELREHGLSDLDILQLCEVVAYYAYVNRIADGLGVTLEGTEAQGDAEGSGDA